MMTFAWANSIATSFGLLCAAWDPHQLYNYKRLERVQHIAARSVVCRWGCPGAGYVPLAKRWLCRWILTGGYLIPDFSFSRLFPIGQTDLQWTLARCISHKLPPWVFLWTLYLNTFSPVHRSPHLKTVSRCLVLFAFFSFYFSHNYCFVSFRCLVSCFVLWGGLKY